MTKQKTSGPGKRLGWTASVLMLASIAAPAAADGLPGHQSASAPMVFVTVANGLWRSVDGSIMRGGLMPGNGMQFQREIMGRTDAEIEQNRQEAIEFYREYYGIDVLHSDGSFIFTDFQVDPGNHARLYSVTGVEVPPEGWPQRMGGWGVFVIGAGGLTLGGKFEGTHVPPGAAMIWGDWNYPRVGLRGEDLGEYRIKFFLDKPALFDQFGSAPLSFSAYSEEFGPGTALVNQTITFLDDNFLLQQDARNILIFPRADD